MFFRFLWQTRAEKVRRCELNMVDVQKKVLSFRLRWLGRLVNDTNAVWKKLGNYWFNQFGGLKLILNSDFQVHNVQLMFGGKMPQFYVEIICAWCMIDKSLIGEELPVEKKFYGIINILFSTKDPFF